MRRACAIRRYATEITAKFPRSVWFASSWWKKKKKKKENLPVPKIPIVVRIIVLKKNLKKK